MVKFRIPVGNGLDIYAGKFVTFLGYEVIESPANLNFSRGLLFTNAIPLTHTGVYADYKFNDTFEAKFGIVDGWNNSISSSFDVPGGVTNDPTNDYPLRRQGHHRPVEHQRPRQERQHHPVLHLLA